MPAGHCRVETGRPLRARHRKQRRCAHRRARGRNRGGGARRPLARESRFSGRTAARALDGSRQVPRRAPGRCRRAGRLARPARGAHGRGSVGWHRREQRRDTWRLSHLRLVSSRRPDLAAPYRESGAGAGRSVHVGFDADPRPRVGRCRRTVSGALSARVRRLRSVHPRGALRLDRRDAVHIAGPAQMAREHIACASSLHGRAQRTTGARMARGLARRAARGSDAGGDASPAHRSRRGDPRQATAARKGSKSLHAPRSRASRMDRAPGRAAAALRAVALDAPPR